jgi:plastocyanin
MSATRAVPAAAFAATVAFMCLQATGLGQASGDATASQGSPPDRVRVLVKDNYFEPRSTEVRAGGKVTWKWRGENRHSIRFTKVPKGASRKGAKSRSEGHWKRVLLRPGVYRYVCRNWAGMRGTVNVRPEPEPNPKPES